MNSALHERLVTDGVWRPDMRVQAEQVRLATMRAPNTALDRLLFEIVSWLMALLSEESRTIAESRQWDIVARYFNSQITRVAANPSPYFENVFNAGDFNVFARRLLGVTEELRLRRLCSRKTADLDVHGDFKGVQHSPPFRSNAPRMSRRSRGESMGDHRPMNDQQPGQTVVSGGIASPEMGDCAWRTGEPGPFSESVVRDTADDESSGLGMLLREENVGSFNPRTGDFSSLQSSRKLSLSGVLGIGYFMPGQSEALLRRRFGANASNTRASPDVPFSNHLVNSSSRYGSPQVPGRITVGGSVASETVASEHPRPIRALTSSEQSRRGMLPEWIWPKSSAE